MGLYTSRHPIARFELVSRPFMAFVRFYCRLRVDGLQHIPQSGAFILAANHSSHADTAVSAAIDAGPRYYGVRVSVCFAGPGRKGTAVPSTHARCIVPK